MKSFFLFLPVVVLALFFGGWAIWWGACSVFEGCVSSTWPKTICTIQESRLVIAPGPHGNGWTPRIIYTYTVDGHSYRGSKIDTRGAWNDNLSRHVVDAYPTGSQRPVYYSPSDPSRSILVNGIHSSSFFGLVLGTIILSFGALFGAMAYLAPKYGTYNGRSYTFDDDSPVGLFAILGIVAILCQFGLLFWILQ
jgi:hypothetical protein